VAKVSQCPAEIAVLPGAANTPNALQAPPLKVPVSYFTTSKVTNQINAAFNADIDVTYPFGRPPGDGNFEPPKKITSIRRAGASWAYTDCDNENLLNENINGKKGGPPTYWDYIPKYPVHSGRTPAFRNYLFFDFHVSTLRMKK
jgi:prepilin-type processing-associated H-X9-DG protein